MSLLPTKMCPHWSPTTTSGRCENCRQEQRERERQQKMLEVEAFNSLSLREKLKRTTYASTHPAYYTTISELETLAYPNTYEKLMAFWGEHHFTCGPGFPTDPSGGGWSLQDAQKGIIWVKGEASRLAHEMLWAETNGTTLPDLAPFSAAFKALVDEAYAPARLERDRKDALFAANPEEVEKEIGMHGSQRWVRKGRRKFGPLFEAAVNARIVEKNAEIQRQRERAESARKEEAILAEARRRIEAMEDERKIQAAMAEMLAAKK